MQTKPRISFIIWRLGVTWKYSQARKIIADTIKYFVWWFYALRALAVSRGNLRRACDYMFILNTWAGRNKTNASRWIYELKNHLVRYLYEHGYCVAVTQQLQVLKCHGERVHYDYEFDEDGPEYECGPYCRHCGGTGIYKKFTLYRFIFVVAGQSFVWHQPQSLVDWKIVLTDPVEGQYEERDNSNRVITLNEKDAFIVSLVVWWALAFRRAAPVLPLLWPLIPVFRRARTKTPEGYTHLPGVLFVPVLCIRAEWDRLSSRSFEISWPTVPEWDMESYYRCGWGSYWQPRWLGFDLYESSGTDRRHEWFILIANKSLQQWTHSTTIRRRIECAIKGHRPVAESGLYCTYCWKDLHGKERRRAAIQ